MEALEIKDRLAVHLKDAITQRQYAKDAIRIAIRSYSSGTFDSVDEIYDANRLVSNKEAWPDDFIYLCEDFAGNGAVPHFGAVQPNKEYYLSKIAVLTFIVYNPSISAFNLYCYDQRNASKDANSMCSLRFRHHLTCYLNNRLMNRTKDHQASPQSIVAGSADKILFLVMDNCVGQNKSQCVFKFYVLLSLLFFERVCLHFLISGHSHMQCDTCWSWCKSSLRNRNLYDTSELVEQYNTVKGVKAELVPQSAFSNEWEPFLDSMFPDIARVSGGYTQYSYFEISDGQMEMRLVNGGPVIGQFQYFKPENKEKLKYDILSRIFGENVYSLDDISSVKQIHLTVANKITIPKKTLESIALKKDFVPFKYWPFYGWERDSTAIDDESAAIISATPKKAVPPKKV